MPICSVTYAPHRAINDLALRAEHELHTAEELTDIELDVLGYTQIRPVEVRIVGEVVQLVDQGVTAIRKSLCRTVADHVVVPQHVSVRPGSRNTVLRRFPVHGRRTDAPRHRPGNTRAARAHVVYRRQFAVSRPAVARLHVVERLAGGSHVASGRGAYGKADG